MRFNLQALSADDQRARAILVVAHPGHELRVHAWLETARPQVWVVTDGSGRTTSSRIASTTSVLKAAGAVAGPLFGQMRDIDLYNAVLSFDHTRFVKIVDQLAAALVANDIDYVAGDAEEGYNPAHDICRLIINAAVRLAKHRSQKKIINYDFTLVGAPGHCSPEEQSNSIVLDLDDVAFGRKLSAARNYPELREEVEAALSGNFNTLHTDLVERARSTFGVTQTNNFRVECLRRVSPETLSLAARNGEPPFYEVYGEKQVIAGHYSEVLRYAEHIQPLAAALDAYVQSAQPKT